MPIKLKSANKRTIILALIFLSIALANFISPAFNRELNVYTYYSMVTDIRIWGISGYFLFISMLAGLFCKKTKFEIRVMGIFLLICGILLLADYFYRASLYASRNFVHEFRFQLTLFLGLLYANCCRGFWGLKPWTRKVLIPSAMLSSILLMIDSVFIMFQFYWRQDWIWKIIMFYDVPLILVNLLLFLFLNLPDVKGALE
jgi:hypothetical protein